MMPEVPATIPLIFAERFSKAYAAFVDATVEAVREAAGNPALGSNRGLILWQTQGLSLIESQNSSVKRAMVLYRSGEGSAIAEAASEAVHLAKMLDGFDLNFSGEGRGKILDHLETDVVIAAYQVCAAAGIP